MAKSKEKEFALFKTQKVRPEALAEAVEPGELCIILTREAHNFTKLIASCDPLMTKAKDYLTTHLGYLAPAKPVMICEWSRHDRHALEQRWLMNEVRKRMAQWTNARRVAIYLDIGCSTADLVMAEDFYFAEMDSVAPVVHWQSFRVLTHPTVAADKLDRLREARIQGHFGFRRWVNENPDVMTSIAIGDELKQFAKAHACKIRILEREELRKLGLNLLLAVGQASQLSPSRLILVEYRPTRVDPILLVGKGITFDTGGINIKAHENLVNCMKNDMGGAALMAHLFMTLVTSGYKKPLILAIPCCENLVGEGAMKPGAVIQSHKGKSVVIEHTDAEGRLILADAISYANDQYRPRLTFSAATLTTAALRQFSGYFTPVHFLGQEYQANLHAAGERWGERFSCWDEFLPFAAGNHTKLADLTNMGRLPSHASMGGGSNVAAHFLKEFCDSPLVHFDIFASTWNWSGDYPGTKSGATGAPFNTMLDFLAGF